MLLPLQQKYEGVTDSAIQVMHKVQNDIR